MANGFQLLVDLGIDNANSRRNIQRALDAIKNDLSLNIDIKVNGSFNNLQSDIRRASEEVDKLNSKINSTGSGSSGSNSGGINRGLTESIDAQLRSLNKLEYELSRTQANYRRAFDPAQAQLLREQIQRLSTTPILNQQQLRQNQAQITELTESMRRFRNATTDAARSSDGLGNSLVNAFKKFSIWITASTIFFGLARSVSDITDQVIMLDTAMTNLARVSNDSGYAISTALERALVNVEELSGRTEDYLKIFNEFSRTGLNVDQSLDLANTATLLQNISELTADETFNSLTAATISFGDEIERTVDIANKLNEVDNNFAITTRDLSLSLNKAASTASTFGVTLDELLGLSCSPLL